MYPKFDHFSKKGFSRFQIVLIAIFHLKKLYEERLILSKVINEKCFHQLSLIESCQHVTRTVNLHKQSRTSCANFTRLKLVVDVPLCVFCFLKEQSRWENETVCASGSKIEDKGKDEPAEPGSQESCMAKVGRSAHVRSQIVAKFLSKPTT